MLLWMGMRSSWLWLCRLRFAIFVKTTSSVSCSSLVLVCRFRWSAGLEFCQMVPHFSCPPFVASPLLALFRSLFCDHLCCSNRFCCFLFGLLSWTFLSSDEVTKTKSPTKTLLPGTARGLHGSVRRVWMRCCLEECMLRSNLVKVTVQACGICLSTGMLAWSSCVQYLVFAELIPLFPWLKHCLQTVRSIK